MNLVRLAVRQPVTVAVGVILILLAGPLALRRIPIFGHRPPRQVAQAQAATRKTTGSAGSR